MIKDIDNIILKKGYSYPAGYPIWDAHSCVPLNPGVDLNCLMEHYGAGVRLLSINISMDMTETSTMLSIISSFKEQLDTIEFLHPVLSIDDVIYSLENNKLGVYFDLEGIASLGFAPKVIKSMNTLGVKQAHLAYNRNNIAAGGCNDDPMALTDIGKSFVDEINGCGMFMDISHTGEKSSLDIVNYSDAPVIYSHGNPSAVTPSERNATDEQIKKVTQSGGITCINGVGKFIGHIETPVKVESYVKHIIYSVDLVGADNVGIGLDYAYDLKDTPDIHKKGCIKEYWWPERGGYTKNALPNNNITPSSLPFAISLLKESGINEVDCKKIMFLNMFRLASNIWK